MQRRRKVFLFTGVLLLSLVVLALVLLPGTIERNLNRVEARPPYPASEAARRLHRSLVVGDLHADTLLWNRDLLERSRYGHVDLPRLQEGNVALQVFTLVTKVPAGLNLESNDDRSDNITWLALLQLWPPRTWNSLTERALFQSARLRRAAERSAGKLTLITNRAQLRDFLTRRQSDPSLTAAILGVEGAHALDGDLANLDRLFAAGIRLMAPTHFFDNDIGGSAHGVAKGGLTKKGEEWLRRLEAKGILLDLAHASPETFDDALRLASRPAVVSHTGVKGTCDNRRNLTDGQLHAIARTGGVVGIGFWPTAVCGTKARSIAEAIRYAVAVAGVNHVALGSDFDGAATAPFDATGLVQITDALLSEGFTESEIRAILGGNLIRVWEQVLPEE